MDLFTFIVVLVYLLATGYLGYQGYRQTKTAADYLVAGRSAHPVVMALSYGATFISTSAIVGFGGVAANFGMGLLWLTFLNIFVGIFIAFVLLGNPTRRMGHHLDAHTFPELLGKRYDSKFIHVFSALIIFCFMPLYATAVIIGGAEFIGPIFHVSYDTALYIFCADRRGLRHRRRPQGRDADRRAPGRHHARRHDRSCSSPHTSCSAAWSRRTRR